MNEILPLIERLGALGMLAGVLVWAGRLAPKVVDQFHAGLSENTAALQRISESTSRSHHELLDSMKQLARLVDEHHSNAQKWRVELADRVSKFEKA